MASRLAILAGLAAAGVAGAADLGTLFHTPEERARLDRMRRGEPAETAADAAPGAQRDPVVTGYVRRSDGRHTVFVDGRPVTTRRDPGTIDPKTLKPSPAPDTAPPQKPKS